VGKPFVKTKQVNATQGHLAESSVQTSQAKGRLLDDYLRLDDLDSQIIRARRHVALDSPEILDLRSKRDSLADSIARQRQAQAHSYSHVAGVTYNLRMASKKSGGGRAGGRNAPAIVSYGSAAAHKSKSSKKGGTRGAKPARSMEKKKQKKKK
jgi:hypothetical protein